MAGLKNLIEEGQNFLRIEFPPKNDRYRREFLEVSLKKRAVFEDVALKYKDPEKTKLHIREQVRAMDYTIRLGELDHWDIFFGKGPMFRQIDTKVFVLSFKLTKPHKSSKILGYSIVGFGILLFLLSLLPKDRSSSIFLGILALIVTLTLGLWVARDLTLWIRGTGSAHRVKGQDIYSDQYFQFAASCGFQGLGKIKILRSDFDKLFKDVIEFLGQISEKEK